jgi:methyl-accepting chemotaxis protein
VSMKHFWARMGLRGRMVLVMASILVGLIGAAGILVINRVQRMVDAETEASTERLAVVVGDAMQAFGEVGEVDGLKQFLVNLDESGAVARTHAVRGPVTVNDFDEREGAAPRDQAEEQVLAAGTELKVVDTEAHRIRYVTPILAEQRCLSCHASAAEGDVLGVASVTTSTESADSAQNSLDRLVAGTFLSAIALTLFVLIVALTRTLVRPIKCIAATLHEGAEQVNQAAEQVSGASQSLAAGATEQASSLEETSAALEQLAAVTQNNASSAKDANELAENTCSAVREGNQTVNQLNAAMAAINDSADQIGKIVKLIEEIAFQTNLLALNAAVEAARAGVHGRGFAVVAGEVRTLAERAAQAAGEITGLIEDSIARAGEGGKVAGAVGDALSAMLVDVTKGASLVDGIAQASTEQAQGVGQINVAVSQMDKVTQQNAAGAQESAAAAEEMSSQAAHVKSVVEELSALICGRRDEVAT